MKCKYKLGTFVKTVDGNFGEIVSIIMEAGGYFAYRLTSHETVVAETDIVSSYRQIRKRRARTTKAKRQAKIEITGGPIQMPMIEQKQ